MADGTERRPVRRPGLRPNAATQKHLLARAVDEEASGGEGESVRWAVLVAGKSKPKVDAFRRALKQLDANGLVSVRYSKGGRSPLEYRLTKKGRMAGTSERPVKRSEEKPKTPEELAEVQGEYTAFNNSAQQDVAFLLRLEKALGDLQRQPVILPLPPFPPEASEHEVVQEAARRYYHLSKGAMFFPQLKKDVEE